MIMHEFPLVNLNNQTMKKILLVLAILTITISCDTEKARKQVDSFRAEKSKTAINEVLDAWHKAAADADFDEYFSKMTDDAIFDDTSEVIKKALQNLHTKNKNKTGISATAFEIALKQLI